MKYAKQKIKTILEENFSNIKETNDGFKINKAELTNPEIRILASIMKHGARTAIKRSGTGVVIIVNILF